jgi:hypothetical protein
MVRLKGSWRPKDSVKMPKRKTSKNKTHTRHRKSYGSHQAGVKNTASQQYHLHLHPPQHGRRRGALSHPNTVEPWGYRGRVSSQAQEKSSQVGHPEHAQNKTDGGFSSWEENDGAPCPLNDSKNPVKTTQDPPMIPNSKQKHKNSWSDASARLVVFYGN